MDAPMRRPRPSGSGDRSAAAAASSAAGGGGERPGLPPMRWGVTYAGFGLLVGLLLSSVAAGAWLGATGEEELSLGGLALSQLALWTGLAGAAVVASLRQGSGRLSVDFGLVMRPLDAVVGPIVGVVGQVGLVTLIAYLLSPFVGHPEISQEATELVREVRGVRLVGLCLFVIVGAPLVEELFFRGLLLRGLRRKMPDVAAISLSSVLFGLAHFQGADAAGLVLVVSLFAFGAVLAVLAVRTGRLGPSIWAHAGFNAFTVVVLVAT